MKVSIVTISFNQAKYLERTIVSVLEQDYTNIEYIVVDPGSSDGSREIIAKYASRISKVILETDRGPADGLNKGFSMATGEVFAFLNSDDVLYPGSIREAVAFLRSNPHVDVVSGACAVIDTDDRVLRLSYSDVFSLKRYAYGACVLMQASTFFRGRMFRKAGGFNIENRSNWDGELFVEMGLCGATFSRTHKIWSGYRLHEVSITGTAKMENDMRTYHARIFQRINGREMVAVDSLLGYMYRVVKHLQTPRGLLERILKGRIYGRIAKA